MDVTSKKKLPLIKKRKTLIGLLQLTTDTWRDEKLFGLCQEMPRLLIKMSV